MVARLNYLWSFSRLCTPPGTDELIWTTGAVGIAEWTGVPLVDVLRAAGVSNETVHVCATGSETEFAKALDEDTLLALTKNGQPLPADPGFPVRLLVPGWIGAYSVKWVGDIELSLTDIKVRRNTESYVMIGKRWPVARYPPARGMPLTTLNIKSALALPWEAELAPGKHSMHGYARSPGQRISAVEGSDNDGQRWQSAELHGPNEKYGWVRFRVPDRGSVNPPPLGGGSSCVGLCKMVYGHRKLSEGLP